MTGVHKPRWMNAEEWRSYQEQTADFKTCLLEVLRRQLAEAHADLEADRDDAILTREHRARIYMLQLQIANAEGTASWQQQPQRPIIVNATRSRRTRKRDVWPASHTAAPG